MICGLLVRGGLGVVSRIVPVGVFPSPTQLVLGFFVFSFCAGF